MRAFKPVPCDCLRCFNTVLLVKEDWFHAYFPWASVRVRFLHSLGLPGLFISYILVYMSLKGLLFFLRKKKVGSSHPCIFIHGAIHPYEDGVKLFHHLVKRSAVRDNLLCLSLMRSRQCREGGLTIWEENFIMNANKCWRFQCFHFGDELCLEFTAVVWVS